MINEIDLFLSEFKIEYRSPPNHSITQCYKIPDGIFYGSHDHIKSYPGNNEI